VSHFPRKIRKTIFKISNEDKVLRKSLKLQFNYRQHRVFIARSNYDQQAKGVLFPYFGIDQNVLHSSSV